MLRRCWRCNAWVWPWPWQKPYCRDVEACMARRWRQTTRPTRGLAGPDLSTEPPPEPDEAPEDLHVCHVCKGLGQLRTTQDWESGIWNVKDCRWCDGTGVEPVRVGYRNWEPTAIERRAMAQLRALGGE